jgi:membrane-bound metal-dependent hydrolase YbcI (DUF457 family)
MMGPTHRCLGGLAGVSVATLQGQPFSAVVMMGLVATATSNGPTSPDGDQSKAWNAVDNVLPQSMRGHRGILHWWGIPAVAWLVLLPHHGWAAQQLLAVPILADLVAALNGMPHVDPSVQWATWALIVGWSSHLAGDFVFGQGHRAGIPLTPVGNYVGLRFDTGGVLENGGTYRIGRIRVRVPSLTRGALSAAILFVLYTSLLGAPIP